MSLSMVSAPGRWGTAFSAQNIGKFVPDTQITSSLPFGVPTTARQHREPAGEGIEVFIAFRRSNHCKHCKARRRGRLRRVFIAFRRSNHCKDRGHYLLRHGRDVFIAFRRSNHCKLIEDVPVTLAYLSSLPFGVPTTASKTNMRIGLSRIRSSLPFGVPTTAS